MTFEIPWNTLFRESVIEGLNLIPEAGAMLSKLVSVLWPEDQPDNLLPLHQLEDYMDQMMSTALDNLEVQQLRNEIDGLKNLITLYAGSGSQGERQENMSYLLSRIEELVPEFWNSQRPWVSLTYIVQFGTIYLTLKRDRLKYYKDIYGDVDSKQAESIQKQKDDIQKFKGRVNDLRQAAITWRKSQVSITAEVDSKTGLGTWSYSRTVVDKQDGYNRTFETRTHPTGDPSPNELSFAQVEYDNRMQFCDTEYADGLDDLMQACTYWDLLDPTNLHQVNPPQQWNSFRIGNGYNTSGNSYHDDKAFWQQHGPITRMIIYHGDWLDGLEVFYGGQSSGLRGARSGTASVIDLANGEGITEMGANAWDYVSKFWVKSNTGVGPIGGGKGNDNWSQAYTSQNPLWPSMYRLAYVAVRSSGNRVDEIRLNVYTPNNVFTDP